MNEKIIAAYVNTDRKSRRNATQKSIGLLLDIMFEYSDYEMDKQISSIRVNPPTMEVKISTYSSIPADLRKCLIDNIGKYAQLEFVSDNMFYAKLKEE